MKNKKQTNFIEGIISSPIFFLGIIVVIFGALIYFSGNSSEENSLSSGYDYNSDVVTIVEYGDYQCPACGSMYLTVEELLKEYEGKVVLDYRHFPLDGHEYAVGASMASECAREQGKFWEMHEKLYKNQKKLQPENLKIFAGELKLDMDKFNSCMDENRYLDKINKEKSLGETDRITATPTVYVNGKQVINSENSRYLPKIDDFKDMINTALEEK
ncbi:DsbA family protein [Candidatus Parcubacteria bacterium]|nr:DsbA family protein [Candidatus Parcubacteria bacterium]